MRLPILLSIIIFCVSACVDTEYSAEKSSGFVRVEGTEFVLNGEPYHYVGANMWYGAYLGAPQGGDRERLLKELDLLADKGVTNLRVLAASEDSTLMRAVKPAIVENENGDLNENLLLGLDFLLAEMAKRDMKAVLYLNNFWQWSGGMSQYVAWFTGNEVLDPDVIGKWDPFMQNSAMFYRLPEAQKLYRKVIERIVTRTNTVTEKPYSADPTIMSWQLANEPRPGSDADGRPFYPAFAEWVDTTAGFIKALAPQQLVSTGNEGAMGTLGDADLFERSHASDNVDYLTFHMWIKNWSWYDATQPEATFSTAKARATDYINTHVAIANRLNKPIVLEEFGVERDGGKFTRADSTQYRDSFYRFVFDAIEHDQQAQGPFAGSNFWAWGGFGQTQREDFMWQPGDDFFGDPPQEAQGLNSVFASDASTLSIINQHYQALTNKQ
ncbi:cellulase family glycosylhydrolase [Gilvimarinus sp. SDUM040013]|uniref:mannan endo-1,4-beta-mannosidase n=1 Tax=Gilvimarinus gilvus TaxID=3058038 RepID=A0ABU4RZ49_9GAMM|nr:cellulase family glycosylhydrolase [Gilvimarinus sp. SDUM040013]MDO3387553.1 cellulase family glycosylhydrolase [Gilvimarinus sp. SDUM040013]MDX6850182.1 cellulase family glycosylhydrolase [Gilvimarinus sp. SDUM040013]